MNPLYAMGATGVLAAIAANRYASGRFQALIRISAWNNGDMRGWFDLVSGYYPGTNPPTCRGFAKKRLMGFEPTTFCMATTRGPVNRGHRM
jgi:hypothetical protein